MRNRRIFQRTPCSIPVVIHAAGKFLYGELVDISLGGTRLKSKQILSSGHLELTPLRSKLDKATIIPLPYDIAWHEHDQNGHSVGLKFSGGIDTFFRGWLADHLQESLPEQEQLLDYRQMVRVPCQLDGQIRREDGLELPCAILDLSSGGASIATTDELLPGESLSLSLAKHPNFQQAEAILLRSQAFSNYYLSGIKFLGLAPTQKIYLEKLTSSLTI